MLMKYDFIYFISNTMVGEKDLDVGVVLFSLEEKKMEGTLIDGPTMLGWSDQILNHFYWPLLNV